MDQNQEQKETIRQIRLKNEVKQDDLAKLLNITPQAYSNKELSKTRFYFDEVELICDFFGISIADVYVPKVAD